MCLGTYNRAYHLQKYVGIKFIVNNVFITFQAKEDINLDVEEVKLDYECEKKPLKVHSEPPSGLSFLSELVKGRFSATANMSHSGKSCTCKVFDKSDPEGEEASKREMKNLKTLRHEKMVRLIIPSVISVDKI